MLDHFQQNVKVRTTAGLIGWVAQSDLLSVDLWQKMQDLEARATTSPVEARGSTKVISNLHIVAGRESPRLRQVGKGVPVELFERQAVEIPAAAIAPAPAAVHSDDGDTAGAPAPATRKEDWWLVRAHLADKHDGYGLDSRPVRGPRRTSAATGLREFGRAENRGVVRAESSAGFVGWIKAAISGGRHARPGRPAVRLHANARVYVGDEKPTVRDGVCGERPVRKTAVESHAGARAAMRRLRLRIGAAGVRSSASIRCARRACGG